MRIRRKIPMKKAASCLSLAALAALAASCASYEAAPIDLPAETAAWRERSADAAGTRAALSFADAKTIGLILSSELNRARAQLAKSRDVEKESGWWEDPSLSLSVKRVLNTGAQPWAYSPGFALTVPVTGLPSLAEEAAAHYAEADFWTLAQAETDFSAALAETWTDYAVAEKKREIIDAYLEKLLEEKARLEKLCAAGEVSAAELQKENDRYNATAGEKRDVEMTLAALRAEIAQRIGLEPETAAALKFSADLPQDVPAPVPSPTAEQLAALPKIRASLAAYDASETALKTEIRRQYPELSLSPSYEVDGNDEFADSLTLGVGFSLPLWNRNRLGIATAKGDREIARTETLLLWRDQFHALRRLEREQEIAQTHCRAQAERSRGFAERTKRIYAEIDAGETSPAALSEAAQQNFSAALDYWNALGDYLKARIRILAMTVGSAPPETAAARER